MRVALGSILFALGLVLPSLASPSVFARKETNAARFARGLPPLPPRSPSPIDGAARPRRSAVPSQTYAGRIEVRYKPSSGSGPRLFLRNDVSALNLADPKNDLRVTFAVPQGTVDEPFNILITNPEFPAPSYVGASGGYLQTGDWSAAGLRNVSQTLPGAATPSSGESCIWTLVGDQLVPQYVNDDGSLPPTKIVYQGRENKMFLLADIDAWRAVNVNYFITEMTFHIADSA